MTSQSSGPAGIANEEGLGWWPISLAIFALTVLTALGLWIANRELLVVTVVACSGSTASVFAFFFVRRLLLNERWLREQAQGLVRRLQEKEETWKELFHSNAAVMLLTNAENGAIVDANASALDFYGYTREAFLTMGVDQITTSAPETVRSHLEMLREGKGRTFLLRNRLIDGAVRDVEVFATMIRIGEHRLVRSIVRDITANLEEQVRAKQLAERLELAVAAAGVGIWDLDLVSNVLEWDEQMFFLYGVARDDFNGCYEAWESTVHSEDIERATQELKLAIEGARPFDTVFRVVWHDCSVRHIRAQGRVHRDD